MKHSKKLSKIGVAKMESISEASNPEEMVKVRTLYFYETT